MKIVTLIENLVYTQRLVAEHGLSVYIETDTSRILFDTGQTGRFLQNAGEMGIDVSDIDFLVLSHGHYDHTGGLYPFLEQNTKARIVAKEGIFVPKYRAPGQFIGTRYDAKALDKRMLYVDRMTELAEGLFVMPEIPVRYPDDTHFSGMLVKRGEELLPDTFDDELFITIKQSGRIHILTACSHRGITNICAKAIETFNLPVGYILGGFHTRHSSAEQLKHITGYFRQLHPASIGACHCTGMDAYALLHHSCNVPVFYNHTGYQVTLS